MVRRINFHAGPGSGKCFGIDTPILMYDGSTQMSQDIRVGDNLMGDNSLPRTVLEVHRGYGELFKVCPIKGDSYTVNEHHTLCLKLSGKRERFKRHHSKVSDGWHEISVSDWLQEGSCYQTRMKGVRSPVDWPSVDVRIPPYILGCWLGDGHSRTTRFTTMDRRILREFKAFALSRDLMVKKVSSKGTGKAKTYSVTTGQHGGKPVNSFLDDLHSYNLICNKHVPLEYLANDRRTRLLVLAGLLDTDGHCSNKGFDFINKRKEVSEGVAHLARSLGFAAYLKKSMKAATNGRSTKKKQYWRVQISGDCSKIPVKLQRKKCGARKQIKDVLRTGISLERVGKGKYFGFEVDGNHRFLLRDFTVVHNSTLAARAFSALKERHYDVEHIPEFVKTMAHEGRFPESYDQVYIFGEQIHREDIALRHVETTVTDCPLLMCCAYAHFYEAPCAEYLTWIANDFNEDFPALNFYIERTVPYVDKGRYQDFEKAKVFDEYLKEMLDKHVEEWHPVTVDHFDDIITKIEERLGADS